MGASVFLKSVDFRAFAVNVKTIAPTQNLYQSGHAIWWFDMPMAMYSFFEEYDFAGKTIIPFNVHNGSRFSGTIATIQELEPDAKVITDGFMVNERDVAKAAGDVADWLQGLGY